MRRWEALGIADDRVCENTAPSIFSLRCRNGCKRSASLSHTGVLAGCAPRSRTPPASHPVPLTQGRDPLVAVRLRTLQRRLLKLLRIVAEKKDLVSMRVQSPSRSRRKRCPREVNEFKQSGEVRSLGDSLYVHNAVIDEIRKDIEER